MIPGLRRVFSFALGFFPPFLILVWIYPKILPVYQHAVLLASNGCLALVTPRSHVRIAPRDRWQVLVERPNSAHWASYDIGNVSLLTFLGLIVVIPLLLATPVRLLERLRLLAFGIPLIVLVHVASVTVCTYLIGFIDDPKSYVMRSLPASLGPFGVGFAVLVWGLLTWRYWLAPPAREVAHRRRTPRR